MKATTARAALLMLAMAGLGGATASAGAATTQIGAVTEVQESALPSEISAGGFAVEIAEASGSYAVPAGYGTITAWSHSAGTRAGSLTFKVYRPTGAKQEFLVIGSDTRTVTAGSVQTFPVSIPVRPGDRIGLSSDDVQLAFETSNTADQLGFFGSDLAVGATGITDGDPFQEFKLDVAATVESAPAGSEPGPSPLGTPYPIAQPRPKVTALKIAPAAFAAAEQGPSARSARRRPVGGKVSYKANVAAKVRFTVRRARPGRRSSGRCVRPSKRNRRAARCTRSMALRGGFTQAAAAATNRFRFTGRLRGRRLAPGAYALIATPSTGGTTGQPVRRGFRIIR